MKIKILLATVAALVVTSVASAQIGWYAKWGGVLPITVKVTGLDSIPVANRAAFDAAMADWSLSPSVNLVASGSGKVRVVVDTYCSTACTVSNYSNGTLHGATLHFNPSILTWSDVQWVFCHELGHSLGLGEGYPANVTGDFDSCMSGEETVPGSGTKLHPSQQDYDVLTMMYPLVSANGKH